MCDVVGLRASTVSVASEWYSANRNKPSWSCQANGRPCGLCEKYRLRRRWPLDIPFFRANNVRLYDYMSVRHVGADVYIRPLDGTLWATYLLGRISPKRPFAHSRHLRCRTWQTATGRCGHRLCLAAFHYGGHLHTVATFGVGHGKPQRDVRGPSPTQSV